MLAPAEVPASAEEVLRAGAVDHRHGLVVDENHFVAFAPPILMVLHDAQRHAEQMAAAARFAIDVIELAVEVLAVALDGRAGRGLAVAGVEVQRVVGQRVEGHEVDVRVECADAVRAFVGDGEARALAVRHGEIAVQRFARRAGDPGAFEVHVVAQVEPEEIAHGRFDAGLVLAVPIAAQDQFLKVVIAVGGDGEPDVRDDACAGLLENVEGRAGCDRAGVGIAAGTIVSGLLERAVILRAGVGREHGAGVAGARRIALRQRVRGSGGGGRAQAHGAHQPLQKAAASFGH